jgi:putative DNA primase/helicase
MGGKPQLVSFLQRALGYSLTGDTREHCLFFLHGSGNNGKTTFLEIMRYLLGDYSTKAEFSTFLAKQSEGPRNDIARLRGARLVAASEADGGKRLAEALIKEITGGDTISARFLHHEFFEFKPQFKIWLAANDKPIIKGTDHGIWRRIRLVPFTVKIPDEEIDKSLPEKLRAELPGIFAWIVQGCLDWQKVGLGEPPEVKQATQEYREEMDVLGDFITAKCRLGPDEETPARLLYREYKSWAIEAGTEVITETAFGRSLSGRGITIRRSGVGKLRCGISLLDHPSQGGLEV